MEACLEHILADNKIANIIKEQKFSTHVAFIIKRGKVLAVATNRVGTRSRGAGWSDATIHAERAVVKAVGDYTQLRGANLYVIRISRNEMFDGHDKILNSEPCHDCHLFLKKCREKYGLNRVFYSMTNFVELDMNSCPDKRCHCDSLVKKHTDHNASRRR